jgi:hypothetical protein
MSWLSIRVMKGVDGVDLCRARRWLGQAHHHVSGRAGVRAVLRISIERLGVL